MDIRFRHAAIRKGFTLMELLAVMVIIGILAGLITAAVARARSAARNTAMKTEISQLENALEAYKNQYGEYPPDFSNRTLVLKHLQNAWPRMVVSDWAGFQSMVTGYNSTLSINVSRLGPANALVFWLGGLPHPNNPKQLLGFSANAANPFEAPLTDTSGRIRVGSRRGPFFDFDPARLIYAGRTVATATTQTTFTNYYLAYRPETGSSAGNKSPYLYFRATPGLVHSGGLSLAYNATISSSGYGPQCWPGNTTGYLEEGGTLRGWTVPYFNAKGTDTRVWYNPNSFQIICAGQDGYYGRSINSNSSLPNGIGIAPHIPYGDNIFGTNSTGIFDNLTNFLPYTVESEL